MFAHDEDTEQNAKCWNWDGFGWSGDSGVTENHRKHDHSMECIWLPIRL